MKKSIAITNTLPITADYIINEICNKETPKNSPPPNLLALILEKQYPEESAMNHELTSKLTTPHQPKKNDAKKRKKPPKNEKKPKKRQTLQKNLGTRGITIGSEFNLLYEIGKRHYPELHNHDN